MCAQGGLRTWERVSSLCRRLKNGGIPEKTGGRLGKPLLSHVQYLFWPDRHAPSVSTPPPYVLQSSWAHGLNRWLRPFEALGRQAIGPADEHE